MKELLVKNERQFQETMNQMIEGIQIHDFNWRYLYVNEALVKYSQYSKEELLGHTVMEKYPGIEQTDVFKAMQRCMIERSTEQLETEFIFPDGTTKYFELSIQPVQEGIFILSVDRSEQRKVEKLVSSNEKRFRALIENSTDMKTLSTKEGKVTYGSPNIEKILGYTTEEFLTKYPDNLIHQNELQDYLKKRIELVKNPGASFHFEQRRQHKNGNWIWCEGTITNMLDDPDVNAMVSNFKDISERKSVENHMEFEHRNLNALINNTKDLMWSVDRNFNLITSNQPFDEMGIISFGKSIPKGGNVLSASYSPEMLIHFKLLYERAFNGEAFTKTEYFDFPVELWTEISYFPISKGDEVIGTACHSRDITELKKGEEKLKYNEARLKEAQAIAHISNWEIDIITGFNSWSDELYNILGIKREEVIASIELYFSYIHPEDIEEVRKNVRETMDTFKTTSSDFRFIRNDGMLRYAYVERKIELDKNNKPKRLYGIMQDITERRISELKLQHQHKELLKSNSELDRFVYSASHDLRAPLLSMQGIIGITAEETKEVLTAEHMKMLNGSISRLDNFIGEILDYSRNARTELKRDTINFNDLLKDITNDLKHLNPNKKPVNIKLDITGTKSFCSDKGRLSVVLNNLISNAIRYSNPEENVPYVKIHINSNDSQTQINIEDNGIGINEANQLKVFEMFYRVSENSVGSGLGLYIVKETVDKLEGEIFIESKPGKGTHFKVNIPNMISK